MLESELWQLVKRGLSGADPSIHMCRIENESGSGQPDIDACRRGIVRYIELKVGRGNWLHFRNSQRSWTVRRVAAGGAVLVLARCLDSLYLWRAQDMYVDGLIVPVDEKSFKVSIAEAVKVKVDAWSKPFPWKTVADAVFSTAESLS